MTRHLEKGLGGTAELPCLLRDTMPMWEGAQSFHACSRTLAFAKCSLTQKLSKPYSFKFLRSFHYIGMTD